MLLLSPDFWCIKAKLKRGTFSATFFLACLAAMKLEAVALEEI